MSLSHHIKSLHDVNTLVPNLNMVLRCLLPDVTSFILDLGLGCTLSLTLSLTEELGQMSKKNAAENHEQQHVIIINTAEDIQSFRN